MNNNESMLGEPKTQEGGDSSSEFDDCEKEIYVRWSSREEDKFPADEDDDDDDTEEDDALLLGRQKEGANSVGNDSNPRWSRFLWLVNKRWFPDSTLRICGAEMLEVEGVKLLKFFLTTIIGIIFVHNYAQWTNSKRDEQYSIRDMILFDSSHIALDIIVFFFVGRMHQKSGVDSLTWFLPVLFTATIQLSGATNVPAVDHSITPYEIHCLWTWQMWALIFLGVVPLLLGLGFIHLRYAHFHGFLGRKVLELALSLLIFLVPFASHPFFHLHHWYYAWLLGMHANLDVWWSRLTMSLLWGIYINGIAVFGRDPILTCAVSLYQSQNQQCPYVIGDYTQDQLASASAVDGFDCSTIGEDYVP